MDLSEDHLPILVVEDDEDTRMVLSDYLASKGYVPRVAANGAEALALAALSPPTIALLDIELPDLFGIELVAPLKALCPEIVIIFITAYDSAELAVDLIQAGAFHYLVKPLALGKVMAVVQEARATYQARANIPANLTRREREIVALLAEGQSNRQIAEQLGLTEQSVKNRLRNIYLKLGVSTRAQAIVRVMELKLTRQG